MAKQPPKKRRQTEQVNVRLRPEQLRKLEDAVEHLRSNSQQPGARYSLTGFMVDSSLMAADKVLGKK